MRDFIGVNTRASDDILFMKKFNNLREYHNWDIPNDVDNISNCPLQKLIFSPSIDQSTLTNFDGFYGQLPRKVFPALKWLAPEMRGLQNYEQVVLEQKPWCVDGLTGIGIPPQYPAPALTNEQRAAPFHFDLISRDINQELIVPGSRLFKNYVSITPGQTYSVEVNYTFVNGYARYLKAWVDADGNGTLDNSEAIFTSPILGNDPTAAGTVAFNLNIPGSPTNRCLKLRLSLLSNGSSSTLEACATHGAAGGPEVFIYDLTLLNTQGTLIIVNSYCDPGVVAAGFAKGFIQSLTIKKGATVVYQKNLKANPPANYFNDGSISNLIKGIAYKIKLGDSPDTKSTTAEIDANLDGDFTDAGENTSFPQSTTFIIPVITPNSGLTVLRITNKNAAGQITGIWEYPVVVTAPGASINGTAQVSPLLYNTAYALTVQANDPTDNALQVLEKVSLPVEQEAPATYLEYAKWVTAVAGRYGSVKVCSNSGSPYCAFMQSMVSTDDVGGPSASGKKLLSYVEMGNEPDKYWYDTEFRNRDEAVWQMAPRQYAAVLDAAYDGDGSSNAFNFNNTGALLGIKNIDPNMKVVMAGISEFRGGYINEMNTRFLQLRANLPKKVPFDVINMHHYSGSTVPAGAFVTNAWGSSGHYDFEGLNGGRGYCPEHAQLKERYAAFIDKILVDATNPDIKTELINMEYWLSEFGYSTNNLSPLRARLESDADGATNVSQSYFKTQAQWLVRSLLELSAMEYKPSADKTIVLGKAQMYELRDYLPASASAGNASFSPGGDLFSHHGLLTKDFKPKKSWYYVQTTKNVLATARFVKDLNPPSSDPNNPQLQFDNGGEAPRIYHYQTSANQHILAIWSPTANKSEQQVLKINIPVWLASRIPGLPNTTNQYTIIQIKDNSESGVRSGHNAKAINGVNHLVFDGLDAPVYISETPIFVLLGVKQDDAVVDCPLPNASDLQVTPNCNSALLQWPTALAGSWRIFVAKKSDLPPEAACDNYKNIDLLGNQFVATQTYDLNASRTRFLLDGLTSGTEYVVFMLFVNINRVPALYPCVRCFTTPTSGTCLINPCLKVDKVNGSPSCDATFDGCNLVTPNTSGSNCFGSGTGACLSGDPGLSINCSSYTAPNLAAPMFQSAQLWAGCSPFEVVVTFKDFVRLDAIRFFHLTGNDEVAIYYTTCECPNEKRYLTTFKPYNSAATWVSITNNLPILPVKKLYFKKLASNHSKTPFVVIGNLHFCGEITTECRLPPSGVLNNGPVRKGAFSSVKTDLASEKEVALSWKPVNRIAAHEEYGSYNQYELYIAEKIPGQTTQFDLTAPMPVYHPEGEEEVTAFLNELDPETAYDALIRIPVPSEPCEYPSTPSDKLKQSLAYGFPDNAVADTLISFVTNGEKESKDRSAFISDRTDQMLLYPNPTDGTVYANWNGNYERLQVWTLEGVLYKDLVLKAEVQEMLINLSDAPPGLYLVQLTGKNRQTLQKKLTLMH